MKTHARRVSPQRILMFAALALSILAAATGEPVRPGRDDGEGDIDWSLVEHIDARHLAKRLMERKHDFRLFDIRPNEDYLEYHIPSALNLPAADTLAVPDPEMTMTVIYGWNSASALALYDLLKERGTAGVHVLRGGLNGWINEVLFPDLTSTRGMTQDDIEQIKRTSLYFGGKPRLGEIGRSSSGRRYLREGC